MGGQMAGQAIYENFVHGDVSGLEWSGAATTRLSANYQDRAAMASRLATALARAWTGEAANAAHSGANPLATRLEMTAPQVSNVARSIEQQLEAFRAAKNSVVPVPPVPEKPGLFDNVISLGNANEDYENQVAAVQSANEHNIAVMTRYENATRQNAAVLAQVPEALGSLPPLKDDRIQETSASGAPIPGSTASGLPSPADGGRSGSGGPTPGGAIATPGPAPQLPSDSSTVATDRVRTGTDSARTTASGVLSPDVGPPKPTPTPPLDGSPRQGLPLGPVGVGYRSGADPTRDGVPGGPRGSGAVGGPRGAGAGNVGEPGARGGAAGGIGTRGPAVVEGAVGRGSAGRAGAPGIGGPVGGGRRGESEDDLEHQRPAFLVEADPDELFGNDEPTAPPVIGG